MTDRLMERLACPRDRSRLTLISDILNCEHGHEYPVICGIPVLLIEEAEQTLWVAARSWARAQAARQAGAATEDWFIDTLGLSNEEIDRLRSDLGSGSEVGPVVRYMVGATCGYLYRPLIGTLREYPIPEFRLPAGSGTVLDIGCNWGRWCVSAARKGYHPIGLDPSLGAVLAAQRVCRQLDVTADFVVADARYLPFRDGALDTAFSYSVIQHFAKEDARTALAEVARAVAPGGVSLIQMGSAWGVRSLYHQFRRRFRSPTAFDVRYWTPPEMARTFNKLIGDSHLSVDGFLGLGIQANDIPLLPPQHRMVVRISEALRRLSTLFPPLVWAADSIYVESRVHASQSPNS